MIPVTETREATITAQTTNIQRRKFFTSTPMAAASSSPIIMRLKVPLFQVKQIQPDSTPTAGIHKVFH